MIASFSRIRLLCGVAVPLFLIAPICLAENPAIQFTQSGFNVKVGGDTKWSAELANSPVLVDRRHNVVVYSTGNDEPEILARTYSGRQLFSKRLKEEISPPLDLLPGTSSVIVVCHGPNMGAGEYVRQSDYVAGMRDKRIIALDLKTGKALWISDIYSSGWTVWSNGGSLFLTIHLKDLWQIPMKPHFAPATRIELRNVRTNDVVWKFSTRDRIADPVKTVVSAHRITISYKDDDGRKRECEIPVPNRIAIKENHAFQVLRSP
jgi:outer membrane protein assembly factor BamB